MRQAQQREALPVRNSLKSVLAPAACCGMVLLASVLPLRAQDRAAAGETEARAERLRAEVQDIPHLVRSTPNIYLVRIESIETVKPEDDEARPADGIQPEEVTAVVLNTLKGEDQKKLTLTVRQRPPETGTGFFEGGLSGDPEKLHTSPVFYSSRRFLSSRNPLLEGPLFDKNKLYVLFTDKAGENLLGGPYGYQRVESQGSYWVQTVKRLVAKPDSEHAIDMKFRDFITKHRSAFFMVIEDCLGTEVSISEPLWGEAVSREDIDPARILPESAAACEGALDRKRGYLGLIETKPYLYQVRRGHPNQSYVELRDDMLDFSELGLDIGFPNGGRISVTELAERMSTP